MQTSPFAYSYIYITIYPRFFAPKSHIFSIYFAPISQTVTIPPNHQLTIDVPREIPTGPVILTLTPAPAAAATHECPVCAKNCDSVTGNPRYNAETSAAIEEGRAMISGKVPAKRFRSLDEMWEDLVMDDRND